jgi:hypothetical protein
MRIEQIHLMNGPTSGRCGSCDGPPCSETAAAQERDAREALQDDDPPSSARHGREIAEAVALNGLVTMLPAHTTKVAMSWHERTHAHTAARLGPKRRRAMRALLIAEARGRERMLRALSCAGLP